MNLKLEFEFNKTDIIKDVDALKKQVDALRPLPADVEGKVMQKLRLDWNYHSNAIEGNRLNYGETVAFLMEGITAKGKPLKDHLDIRGHNDAINFLLEIVKDTRPITEADIRALHEMILVEPYDSPAKTAEGLPTTKRIALGEYKTSPNHVKTSTGEIHYYASPEETPVKMHELMDWYEEVGRYDISPIIIAALFHHRFVAIHPFDDGNGRLSRILMNLILMQSGYPPVVVKMGDRTNYYSLLSRADVGDTWPFVEYVAELMQSSLQLYLKAANGGDIDEDEDIDKEIALLKLQLNKDFVIKEKKSKSSLERIFVNSILPLSKTILNKLSGFDAYFFLHRSFFSFSRSSILGKDTSTIAIDNNSFEAYKKEVFKEHYSINEMQIVISFEEYKDLENKFNLYIDTKILFEEYQYTVLVDNEYILSKMYNEDIQLSDQNKIVKQVIRFFKKQLGEKQKSPKP
jgi:Fic family protein